jgi:aryl-alcohol dehydrogenase-like predicted oxidoreductase
MYMEYRQIGNSDLNVSKICLGTMTFGEQNTRQQGFEQLDFALSKGVNFIDTAEMYSVPPRRETYGNTETIIGQWLKARGCRDQVVLASKVAGPGLDYIRGGPELIADQINHAVNASLKRLNTDYLDVYQVHWPSRETNYFGRLGFEKPNLDKLGVEIFTTLEALSHLVDEGKIRYIGISNETPWGIMQYLRIAEEHHLQRIISIQNPYSLLNRSFEVGLSEICFREGISCLPYSPLGMGMLTGKYLSGAQPEDARLTLFPNYKRYSSENSFRATQAYCDLARKNGLTPAQMALAFANDRFFVSSNIIGATNLTQLDENIASAEVQLSPEVLSAIDEIHQKYPNPAP